MRFPGWDGPEAIDASLDLLSVATAEGTGTVVATPHVRGDFVTDVSDLAERVRELQLAVEEAALPVRLRCGGELGHDMVGRLSQGELETIAQGPPHARWLLVEAPFELIDEDFHAATEELRDRGFGVVIAHPSGAPTPSSTGPTDCAARWSGARSARSTPSRSPARTAPPQGRRRSSSSPRVCCGPSARTPTGRRDRRC